jgi:ABC-2 type transport system ATP-binding protein
VDGAAVRLEGVTRQFSGRLAIQGLNLEVPAGTVFGFLGPNGAGKTTTVRMMLGLLPPSAGTVRVFGLDPVREGERIRSQTGVLPDSVGLYDRMTARQNLDFAGRIAGLDGARRNRAVEAALQRVELWDRRDDRVSGFSKGMRQKLGIARAMLAEPRLLILDEPTSGLDPVNIVMLRELLSSLAQEGGRTIFMCTHHLDEAQRLCQMVGIIQAGRLAAVGSPSELGSGGQPQVRIVCSRLDPASAGMLALPAGATISRAEGEGEWRVTLERPEDVEEVVAALVRSGAGVRAVVPEQRSLEDVYLSVVGGQPRA